MMIKSEDAVALRLIRLHPDDRNWLLAQLDEEQRLGVQRALKRLLPNGDGRVLQADDLRAIESEVEKQQRAQVSEAIGKTQDNTMRVYEMLPLSVKCVAASAMPQEMQQRLYESLSLDERMQWDRQFMQRRSYPDAVVEAVQAWVRTLQVHEDAVR